MSNAALGREAARYQATRILDHLGKAPRERLSALLPLIEADGRIQLGDALETLFPGQGREEALTAFRQFRADVGRAAQDAGVALALEADRQTRTPPDQRWCWFTGEDAAMAVVTELGQRTTAGVAWSPQSALRETPTKDGKPLVRFFVSYAHADRKHKDALLELLLPRLRNARDYAFELWDDNALVLGDGWRGEIRRAIDECRFGLLLVSHEFLASRFITAEELPHFVAPDLGSPAPGRRALPVALKPVPFDDTIDLKGLREIQVFRDSDRKAFSERTGARRERFAAQLFAQIIKAVGKHPPPPPPLTGDELDSHLRDYAAGRMKGVNFVCSRAAMGNLEKLQAPGRSGEPAEEPGERGDALALLEEWLNNPKGQPYAALLGELGMGKTTTAMEFTQRLLKARQTDPAVPLPLYLDLRNLGDLAKSRPSLPAMLDTLVQGIWQSGRAKVPLTADDVLRLVQTEGALVIIDGLDEVLVHLTPSEGERFTRELLRILPPRIARAAPPAGERRGRLLVTCRTHYFRTLRDEKTLLRAEDRDAVTDTDYRILVLLPFTQDQIRDYLARTLPGEDTDRLLELIGAVHNLTEMAERPYLLSLIAKHIPEIERWKLEGRRVTGVDLYRHMVLSWLERDNPKHQITPDHKQRLMEFFAAELWRSGRRSWSVEKLEQWLIDFLAANPSLAAHYTQRDREILKEDLRTATFLVREGEDQFRFAHSSLQEYFLAAHLHRALKEGRVEAWDLAMPSTETLDFLGQLLHGDGEEGALSGLRQLRDAYRPGASELAFGYTLMALAKGYPAVAPARTRLEGADLRGWVIAGPAEGPRLNLTGAYFRGARLADAAFHRVDLSDADLSDADLARAELIDARAVNATLDRADLTGTIVRNADLTGASLDDATLHRTQFLMTTLTTASGLEVLETRAFFALCTPDTRFATRPADGLIPAVMTGHDGDVRSSAFSPDGERLASAGGDGTVRVWDAASGEVLMILRGHGGGVWCCAFSPDGTRLASAGGDGTVRLWRAAGGASLAVLRGHDGPVLSCAFSPDERHLASTGIDGTVRVWDAAGGASLAVLRGHDGRVTSSAFSPDGVCLASTGEDGTVRLWSAASGEALAVLRGHDGQVNCCAFSPDGRLASAGGDRTVRVWDAVSGEPLAVLCGHDDLVSACVFSPDGGRLASAGFDGTVRVWDAAGGESLAVLRGHDGWVRSCAFSPYGGRLASAGGDGTMRVWDPAIGEALAVLRREDWWVLSCAFSPDGGRLVSVGEGGPVRVWDTGTGASLALPIGHDGGVWFCIFAPDGERLALAGSNGLMGVWDAAGGEPLAVMRGHDGGVGSCAFSPDGSCLVSAGYDGTVRVWDAASGKSLGVLSGHDSFVFSASFSPDGMRVVSAGHDGTVRVWDWAAGETLAVLHGHDGPVSSCVFSPDGRRVVSAGDDGMVRLWDAVGGEALTVLRGHNGWVLSCAFWPDRRRLASAGEDRTVRLWDLESGELLLVLSSHDGPVSACAFSPDGSRLALAGADGAIRLWDVASGKPVGFQFHHLPRGSWAVLDAAGSRIIDTGGEAWRWLAWQGLDEAGRITRYPAEIRGPLPRRGVQP